MKQAQETAAESKAQGKGGLWFIEQGGIIELELLQRVPQVIVFGAVSRIKAAVHHGGYLLIAGQRGSTGVVPSCHRIADPGIPNVLNAGRDVSYHARAQLFTWYELSCPKIPHFHHVFLCPGCHHADGGAFFHRPLHDAAENDDPFIGIIGRIENQGLERRLGVPCGGRYLMDNGFQHILNIDACLGRYMGRVTGIQANHILNLRSHPLRLRAWKVNFINDREHVQVMVQGQIHIGQCLGLYALGCIHHQHRAVTGRKAAGYLIVKVYVSGGVDKVENVFIPILCLIYGADRLGFDGNPALPLQIHIVQYLFLHLPAGQQAGFLNDTVSQGGLAVVDVCYDTKISDFTLVNVGHIGSFLTFRFLTVYQPGIAGKAPRTGFA